MDYWDWRRPGAEEILALRRFRDKLPGTSLGKLERWLQAARSRRGIFDRYEEPKDPRPHRVAKARAQAELEAIERELSRRRLGDEGPFR